MSAGKDEQAVKLTKQDFVSGNDVRWCPRCGDYAILSTVQKVFPDLGIPKEDFVVVSGIGCSSRFPYYMNTYGFHTIHGRAPAVATGVKVTNPDLSVWMITGDGDGLSIGGNHLLHILRRNIDVNILLFNNRIYGLTKGQYSPTSELGKKTKTTPMGSIDHPINPLCFAIAAEATFVARSIDTNPKHMATVLKAAAEHKGVSFVEIFQNCVIFNHQAFEDISGRDVRDDRLLMLEHGKPLIFGKDRDKGIMLKGMKPTVVTIGQDGVTEDDLLVHDENDPDPTYAYLLSQMNYPDFPTPMGVFRSVEGRAIYEDVVEEQISSATEKKGRGNLQMLVNGAEFWEVGTDGQIQSGSNDQIGNSGDLGKGLRSEQDVMKEITEHSEKGKAHPINRIIQRSLQELIDSVGLIDAHVSENASIAQAISELKKDSRGCLAVHDDSGKFVGMLSERDVTFNVACKDVDRQATQVKSIMKKELKILPSTVNLAYAINDMSISGFRQVFVDCSDGKRGIVSVEDMLSYIHQESQKLWA